MMVTTPSGAMRMKALSGAASPAASTDVSAIATPASGGSTACNSSPPPAAAPALKKARLEGMEENDATATRLSEPSAVMVVMITSPPRRSIGRAPLS